jgi:MFS family permease
VSNQVRNSINIFVWAVALLAHSACKSFGALFVVRCILGICEGAITPGFMIVTSMFYTREEQTKRVGYWFLMNGFAVIFLGFISFGLLHTKTHSFKPWQWLMIITGTITLVTSVVFWFIVSFSLPPSIINKISGFSFLTRLQPPDFSHRKSVFSQSNELKSTKLVSRISGLKRTSLSRL